jgi:hypothetical protein
MYIVGTGTLYTQVPYRKVSLCFISFQNLVRLFWTLTLAVLVEALAECGFVRPTNIQVVLSNRTDLSGSGSGSYLLSISGFGRDPKSWPGYKKTKNLSTYGTYMNRIQLQ